jgi:hypothetical protein
MDDWDLEIVHSATGQYEAIEIRGSSRGRPMMFASRATLNEAEAELMSRYPNARLWDRGTNATRLAYLLPDQGQV